MRKVTDVAALYGRNRRRGVTAGFAIAAVTLCLVSTAYACTLLIGQFQVCEGTDCASRSLTGPQTNLLSFNQTGGDSLTISATGMSDPSGGILGTTYSITYGPSGPSCHIYNPDLGVRSLIGTTNGQPNTVNGPSFSVNATTPDVTPLLGLFSVCTQDEPERVDGNFIWATVL